MAITPSSAPYQRVLTCSVRVAYWTKMLTPKVPARLTMPSNSASVRSNRWRHSHRKLAAISARNGVALLRLPDGNASGLTRIVATNTAARAKLTASMANGRPIANANRTAPNGWPRKLLATVSAA